MVDDDYIESMKNILARGGIEFLAVFLGIALSLWVDEYQKSKEAKKLNDQILSRLYDNLKADSIDAEWNYRAHKVAYESGNLIFKWCENGQPQNDSINLYLSRLAIATIFVNNEEEYNALKSSGSCLLYTSPSPRDATLSRMPSSA